MDIIKTYNPANSNITVDELNAMKDLTNEQIAQLAKEYPNTPNGNAYLVYYNKANQPKDQLYPLGTWANLAAVRKLGLKDILPYSFKDKFYQKRAIADAHKPAPKRTVDLSHDDLKAAEGLKKPDTSTINEPAGEAPGIGVTNGGPAAVTDPKLAEMNQQMQQLKADGAHHMTIKKLEKDIEDHKASLNAAK